MPEYWETWEEVPPRFSFVPVQQIPEGSNAYLEDSSLLRLPLDFSIQQLVHFDRLDIGFDALRLFLNFSASAHRSMWKLTLVAIPDTDRKAMLQLWREDPPPEYGIGQATTGIEMDETESYEFDESTSCLRMILSEKCADNHAWIADDIICGLNGTTLCELYLLNLKFL